MSVSFSLFLTVLLPLPGTERFPTLLKTGAQSPLSATFSLPASATAVVFVLKKSSKHLPPYYTTHMISVQGESAKSAYRFRLPNVGLMAATLWFSEPFHTPKGDISGASPASRIPRIYLNGYGAPACPQDATDGRQRLLCSPVSIQSHSLFAAETPAFMCGKELWTHR